MKMARRRWPRCVRGWPSSWLHVFLRMRALDVVTSCIYNYAMKETLEDMVDEVAGTCIAVRLRMLNRVITNVYDGALRPLGLKVSQMNILVAAAKMGTARPVDVCKYLHLDGSTLSRNVERMKARSWLEVVPNEDGRS